MASHLKVPSSHHSTDESYVVTYVITYDRTYLLFSDKQQPKEKDILKGLRNLFNSTVHNI